MTEPTTEAGRNLLANEAYNNRSFALVTGNAIAAIEEEARQGYVPASLSPEWHAELEMSRAEGAAAERDRLRAAVEGLKPCPLATTDDPEWPDPHLHHAAILALLEDPR